ncbi:MAG: hypothetical protein EOP33_03125 [Rickettsiaceae bacterium]|nr:MAG: hypothetical protein EOP33_03125 [Rickettsiaceae bacterium]
MSKNSNKSKEELQFLEHGGLSSSKPVPMPSSIYSLPGKSSSNVSSLPFMKDCKLGELPPGAPIPQLVDVTSLPPISKEENDELRKVMGDIADFFPSDQ